MFWDSDREQFTVSKYLRDLKNRFGGIDSIIIWPSYPNLGIDTRNQYDFFRAMPG
eukprot:gene5691-6269_t